MRRTWIVLLMMVALVVGTLPAAAWGQSEDKRGRRFRGDGVARADGTDRAGRARRELVAQLRRRVRLARGATGKIADRRQAVAAAALGLHQVGSFGDPSDSPAGTILFPGDAAVDANGNILIVSPADNTIHVVDGAGNPVRTYPGGEPVASTAPGRFDTPQGIAVNRATGDIYVTEEDNHRVQRFDSNFNFLAMWGSNGAGNGQFDTPDGVAVNPVNNRVYVVDTGNARVQVFEADGTFVASFTDASFSQPAPHGVDVDDTGRAFVAAGEDVSVFDNALTNLGRVTATAFSELGGAAVSRDGLQVWATDEVGDAYHWTVAYNPDGTVSAGSLNPDFTLTAYTFPRHVTVVPTTNDALIANLDDLGPGPLIRVDQNGSFVANIGTRIDPLGLMNFPGDVVSAPAVGARSSERIFAADTGNSRVQKFAADGTLLGSWGVPGDAGGGQLWIPIAIAADSAGDIYTADLGSDLIQVFDQQGNFKRQWGGNGSADGEFDGASGIAIDSNDTVYVADNFNNRIQVFDKNGNFLRKFGSQGAGAGQLDSPWHIEVDAAGNLYVAEENNSRIQKFDNAGNSLMMIGVGEFNGAYAVTVDAKGNIYGADFEAATSYRAFDPAGAPLGTFGSLTLASGIHAGANDRTYVIDEAAVGQGFVFVPNTAPVANDDTFATPFNTMLEVAAPGVLANDTDSDGDGLAATLVDAPSGGGSLTLNNDGSFTYSPPNGFIGNATFTYTVSDGVAARMAALATSNVASATITVAAPVNNAPVAVNDSYTVTTGTTLSVAAPGVLANDTDADGDALRSKLDTAPTKGAATVDKDGSFTYTPDAGFSGPDSFDYEADDGIDIDIATVAITVEGNNAPTAVDDSYSTSIGTPLTVAAPGVLDNDTDPDGNSLTVVLATGPANGTLSLAADGSFTYTPNAGFSDTDSFTYTAEDGLSRAAASVASSPATVTITVTGGGAPNAVDDAYSLSASKLVTAAPGVLGNDTDPEGQALTAALVSGPAKGSLTLGSDGGFTYTPNPGFSGNDSFVYQASDGTLTANATATIAVQACAYAVSPASASFAPPGGTTTATLTTAAGCEWSALSNDAWLGLSRSGGTGSATITLTIDSNTGSDRTTQAVVGGQTVVVQQAGPACSYSLNNERAGFGSDGGGNTFTVTTSAPACAWSATSTQSWIGLGGRARTGTGTIAYTVATHTGNNDRKGKVRISAEGKNLTVRIAQQGVAALEPLPPRNLVLRVRRKTSIKVRWGDAADNETGYLVKRRARGAPNSNFTLAADRQKIVDKRLLPLTEYCYEVQAFNDQGFSPKVSACATTQAARVATGLRVTHAGRESVKLEWSEEAGASQILERRVANSSDWLVVAEPEGGRSEIVDRGLFPNTLYEYRLRTCLTRACEATSNSALALTLGGDGLQQPNGHEPRAARHVTVPMPVTEIGFNVADMPNLPVARIYKDADNGWSKIPADEDALSEFGYALGVNLFVHPLADLGHGVPKDTHLLLLPRADEAALRAIADPAAQEALRSYLAGGGVLVVQQAGGAYRLPVDDTEHVAAADSQSEYRRLDVLGGMVLLSDEPLERVRDALLVALSNWRSQTETPRR